VLNQLRYDKAQAIGRDGEANAVSGRLKLSIHRRQRGHPDQATLQILD